MEAVRQARLEQSGGPPVTSGSRLPPTASLLPLGRWQGVGYCLRGGGGRVSSRPWRPQTSTAVVEGCLCCFVAVGSTVKAPRGLLGQTLPDGGCGGLTTSGPHYTPNTHSTPRRTFHRLFHRQLLHKGRLAWSARSLRSIPNANRTARPDLEFFLAWVLPLHQNSRMGKNDI